MREDDHKKIDREIDTIQSLINRLDSNKFTLPAMLGGRSPHSRSPNENSTTNIRHRPPRPPSNPKLVQYSHTKKQPGLPSEEPNSFEFWRKKALAIHRQRNPPSARQLKQLRHRNELALKQSQRLEKLIRSKEELKYQVYCANVEAINQKKAHLKSQRHALGQSEKQELIRAIREEQRLIEAQEREMFLSIN